MKMKKQTAGLSLLLATLLYLAAGCERVDHYATDPSLRLDFSTDTLTFDTLFTTIGSVTKQFIVYNPHGENLRIESVTLASGGRSGFRLNVDGRKGDSFSGIDLWKRDSLRVLVEVTASANNADRPLLIQDSILFYTNGVRQFVLLQAVGQDVHIIRGGRTYTENTTLPADRPYLVFDSLIVGPGVTLSLAPGATLCFHHQAKLIVAGTLKAIGTQAQPITLRGDRLDSIYANVTLPYDRVPGQWGGIRFESTSFENELEYADIRTTSFGLDFRPSTPDRRKIRIHNSRVTNSSGDLLTAVNCHIEASGSEFTNAAGNTVCLIGGRHRFAHCTLANFIVLTTRQAPTTRRTTTHSPKRASTTASSTAAFRATPRARTAARSPSSPATATRPAATPSTTDSRPATSSPKPSPTIPASIAASSASARSPSTSSQAPANRLTPTTSVWPTNPSGSVPLTAPSPPSSPPTAMA